jgi:BirA family transcriptional regulator, biotin operon repressor / biotin---[acetyl-CoA-carboxylase] ligase
MTIASARCFHLTTVDSTNLYTRQRFDAGEDLPFWIRSDEQTAGRGRSGRNWVSVPGNLYASFAFEPGCETAQLSQVALVISIAMFETVCKWTPGEEVRLKWPNDCLVNGAKISGILIETLRLAAPVLVIGCGINIVSKPTNVDYPTTALHDFDPDVTVGSVFEHLGENLDVWLAIWNRGAAFAEIRNEWLGRAKCLGEKLSVRDGKMRSEGVCIGLNSDGALLLEKTDGTLSRIYAGDVSLVA